MKQSDYKIAIIGLGYVGLPLAVEFGKKYQVIGFDIDINRIEQLENGIDRTLESNKEEIAAAKGLSFSSVIEDLNQCNIFIVTVPTPIDQFKAPDLKPLIKASEMIGKVLKKEDIVIYESTVVPRRIVSQY
jgi:UDP-N-acetyl-D-galactosamine dehydrogenase